MTNEARSDITLAGRLLRLSEVLKYVPVGRSTWYTGMAAGRFPKSVKVSARVTCWRGEDIANLINAAK